MRMKFMRTSQAGVFWAFLRGTPFLTSGVQVVLEDDQQLRFEDQCADACGEPVVGPCRSGCQVVVVTMLWMLGIVVALTVCCRDVCRGHAVLGDRAGGGGGGSWRRELWR